MRGGLGFLFAQPLIPQALALQLQVRLDFRAEVPRLPLPSEHGTSPPLRGLEFARSLPRDASILWSRSPAVFDQQVSTSRTVPCDCWKKLPTLRKSSCALPAVAVRGTRLHAPQTTLLPKFPEWPARFPARVVVRKSACAGSANRESLAAAPVVPCFVG